jgi:HKD family nuclease
MQLPKAQLQIIENSGPNNLRDFLKAHLPKASQVDIAVAFATKAGVDKILSSLRQAASRGPVRILVGLYQAFSEPQALKTLLRAQDQTNRRLSVRLSHESKFHWKLYLMRRGRKLIAIVGSSNLTGEALQSGGELSTALFLPATSPAARRLCELFEEEWKGYGRGGELTNEQIELYEKRRGVAAARTQLTRSEIREIMGASPIHRRASDAAKPIRQYWRHSISRTVLPKTQLIIGESTDWDKKGYDWYVPARHKYKKGDRLALFDFRRKAVTAVEIVDLQEISTSDGRHFVAFKPLGRVPKKRLTQRFWRKMKTAGLISSKARARERRKLSEARWQEVLDVLRSR